MDDGSTDETEDVITSVKDSVNQYLKIKTRAWSSQKYWSSTCKRRLCNISRFG
ncbi:MAG: hypothetical protein IPJ26_13255 [Bacteroidetes bacterium]|nr:hypothetical protein [Bacteroidota bacterium]